MYCHYIQAVTKEWWRRESGYESKTWQAICVSDTFAW